MMRSRSARMRSTAGALTSPLVQMTQDLSCPSWGRDIRISITHGGRGPLVATGVTAVSRTGGHTGR
eukprot:8074508-Lingulodinium_polyedra.AAC.1